MLPPTCTGRPAACQHVREQRRGRRLAVRAGDRHHLRHPVEVVPGRRRERAEEQADVVVDRDPGVPGRRHRRMRRRIEVRDPRRDDQRLHPLPGARPRQVGQRDPVRLRLRPRRRAVVPGDDLRPAGRERRDRRQPRPPEPEHRHLVPGIAAHRDHAQPRQAAASRKSARSATRRPRHHDHLVAMRRIGCAQRLVFRDRRREAVPPLGVRREELRPRRHQEHPPPVAVAPRRLGGGRRHRAHPLQRRHRVDDAAVEEHRPGASGRRR